MSEFFILKKKGHGLFLLLLLGSGLSVFATEPKRRPPPKEQVLDFSAGVIEGELNRPSILMELGTNFKDFNDLTLLREDFNSFHEIDSVVRLRYMEE